MIFDLDGVLCNNGKVISPVADIFKKFGGSIGSIWGPQIWCGRCESMRDDTIDWLVNKLDCFLDDEWRACNSILKMKPFGSTVPNHVIKEHWLDNAIYNGKTIEFVFDCCDKSIEMWRRRGVFVFNCSQNT
jgi:pyruvate dehydrogenase complex dehydrogenase (E1) component